VTSVTDEPRSCYVCQICVNDVSGHLVSVHLGKLLNLLLYRFIGLMEIHVEIYYLFIQAVNGDFIICSYFLYIAALKHSNR